MGGGRGGGAPPPDHGPEPTDVDEETFAKDFHKHYSDEEMEEHAHILEGNEEDAEKVNEHGDKYTFKEKVRWQYSTLFFPSLQRLVRV